MCLNVWLELHVAFIVYLILSSIFHLFGSFRTTLVSFSAVTATLASCPTHYFMLMSYANEDMRGLKLGQPSHTTALAKALQIWQSTASLL
jgi:hypothetical protein